MAVGMWQRMEGCPRWLILRGVDPSDSKWPGTFAPKTCEECPVRPVREGSAVAEWELAEEGVCVRVTPLSLRGRSWPRRGRGLFLGLLQGHEGRVGHPRLMVFAL